MTKSSNACKKIKFENANPNSDDDARFCMEIRNKVENSVWFFDDKKIDLETQKEFMRKEKYFFIMFDGLKRIGTVSLYNINEVEKSAEVGRSFIIKEMRRKGYGTIAKVFACQLGFKKGLTGIYSNTKTFNRSNIGLLKKLGFVEIESRPDFNTYVLLPEFRSVFYYEIAERNCL